jgi:hypothetical protein
MLKFAEAKYLESGWIKQDIIFLKQSALSKTIVKKQSGIWKIYLGKLK